MRDANAIVAHCPDSNLFLGSGGMPTRQALDRDLRVCVGTDVAAGRTFSIREILACAYDNARAQGVGLPLETLFYWGTRGGALALGVPEVGQIADGMDADMMLMSLPEWVTSKEDCLGSLLFDRAGTRVERTWVKGREVYRAES
jgi:guanine deaminase